MTGRRALVTLPAGVWEILDTELKGKLGDGDSEVIRNIVISHLTEKGYLLKPKEKPSGMENIATELDMQDTMLTSLAEVLEEKGQLNYNEWESRIKRKMAEASATHKSQSKGRAKS
jgi:metal-responsive CopG/Arc/MetJ family transcriptional regulator